MMPAIDNNENAHLREENKELRLLLVYLLASAPFNTLYISDKVKAALGDHPQGQLGQTRFDADYRTALWWVAE